jgi:hypothetical protein
VNRERFIRKIGSERVTYSSVYWASLAVVCADSTNSYVPIGKDIDMKYRFYRDRRWEKEGGERERESGTPVKGDREVSMMILT